MTTAAAFQREIQGVDAIDALAVLAKGNLPTGKGNNVNDSTNTRPPGAKVMAKPGAGAPPKPPGNAGQEEPETAKPGEGKPGSVAQPGLDPEKGSIQYPTKAKNPETGEFEFAYLGPAERDEAARFVVSDETAEGAHWELPQDSEYYAAFKQWKSAKKQDLHGTAIPKELVDGALKHAERHHFDGGPHKAAFDDHTAHQGEDDGPQAPPSHHSVKGKPGSHPSMQGKPPENGGQPGAKQPPGNAGQGGKPPEKDMIGKLVDFVQPSLPSQDDFAGANPAGTSRNGLEHATSGPAAQSQEDAYHALYGLKRSGEVDAIEALGALVKGGGHKYKSRKRVGGKWVYEYGEKKASGPTTLAEHAESVKDRLDEARKRLAKNPGDAGAKKQVAELEQASQTSSFLQEQQRKHEADVRTQVEKHRAATARKPAGDAFPQREGVGSGAAQPPELKVITHLTSNPRSTLHAVAQAMGVSPDVAKGHLSSLVASGAVRASQEGRLNRTYYSMKKSADPMFVQRGDRYELRKGGIYSYDLSRMNDPQPISDRLLYDYLCGFIEEAYEHEKREATHRNPVAGEDFYETVAQPVMHELVAMIPKNKNLARAAKKFTITTKGIAEIMKKKGYIKPATDGHHDHGDKWSSDHDSALAMGINQRSGPVGEVLMASMSSMAIRPDPLATRNLQLRKAPEMVYFKPETYDPTGSVRRLSLGKIQFAPAQQLVKANYNPRCVQHGDIHKGQQLVHQEYAQCSCPR